jgi:tetratricopeptide (TPR) repeat protein
MKTNIFKSKTIFFLSMFYLTMAICIITEPLLLAEENLPAVIKRVEPSIIVLLTYDKEGKFLGQGTGFFITQEGDVITNYHVLKGASRADVRMSDGKMYPVKKVIAEDEEGDLIRVSIDIPKEVVRPLSIQSSFPEVGERIIVIGTPLGLEKTVSDGIVSAVREVPDFGKIIQVTAPISPGSSGSPVVNMKGEVVGVVSFFLMPGQNLNFAVPGERIARLTPVDGKTLSQLEETREEQSIAIAKQLYAMGRVYLWTEDYEKALPYFAEVVKKNPNYADAYFQIGYCLGKLGRYSEAIEPYRQAIRIKPGDIDTLNNLCVAYGILGRYDEAIEVCKEAIRIKADLPEAYNNLGWTYHKLGRYQEAIDSCKQAIRLKPDFAMAHYNLGNNYFALKKFNEAIESYKQTIRINFDYAEGHMNLGAAYNQTGRYEEAIESYKQAVLIKPNLAEAHLNLGMTYLRVGDRGSALEEYKILKDQDKELANRLFNLIYE